jgi:prepilin peptidase CpaA
MLNNALTLLLFPATMAFAASSDLFTMTISNKISLLLVAGFLVLAPMIGMSPGDIAAHLGAGVSILAITFGFFAFGWIGGGDAKLAAAIALWLGFAQLLPFLLYASLIGGALTLVTLRFRAMPMPRFLVGKVWAERLHQADAGVPYGIALAAAALLVYPETPFMKAVGL